MEVTESVAQPFCSTNICSKALNINFLFIYRVYKSNIIFACDSSQNYIPSMSKKPLFNFWYRLYRILYNTGQKFGITLFFIFYIFEVVLTKAALNWPKTQYKQKYCE